VPPSRCPPPPARPARSTAADPGRSSMTVKPERQSGLGRGLAALIPQRSAEPGPTEVPIGRTHPTPLQPRRHMDQAELEALAASVAEHGVLLPVLVTQTLDGYQLIA